MGRVLFHCRAEGAPKNLTEGLNCRAKRKGRGPGEELGQGSKQGWGRWKVWGCVGGTGGEDTAPAPKGTRLGVLGCADGHMEDPRTHQDLLSSSQSSMGCAGLSCLHTAPVSCRHPQIEVSPSLTSFPPSPHIPQLPKNLHTHRRLRTAIPGPLQRDGERERAAAPPGAPSPPGDGTCGVWKHQFEFLASCAIVWPGKGRCRAWGGDEEGWAGSSRESQITQESVLLSLALGVALSPLKTGGGIGGILLFILKVTPFGAKYPLCGQTLLFLYNLFINIIVIIAIFFSKL